MLGTEGVLQLTGQYLYSLHPFGNSNLSYILDVWDLTPLNFQWRSKGGRGIFWHCNNLPVCSRETVYMQNKFTSSYLHVLNILFLFCRNESWRICLSKIRQTETSPSDWEWITGPVYDWSWKWFWPRNKLWLVAWAVSIKHRLETADWGKMKTVDKLQIEDQGSVKCRLQTS